MARRGPVWTLRWVGLVLAAGLLLACEADVPETESPSGPTPDGPVGEATRDGITVTVSLDRAVLTATEPAFAVVTVENRSPEPRFWQGGRCNLPASVWIDSAANVTAPVGHDWPGTAGQLKDLVLPASQPGRRAAFVAEGPVGPAGDVPCPGSRGVNRLPPGQRLEIRASWAGEVNAVAAPPGPAVVTASFSYLGPGPHHDPSGVADAIQARVTIAIVPSPLRLLAPGEAIDAALADRAFAAWLATAGGQATWEGAELQQLDRAYVLVLQTRSQEGRATVDRRSGTVSFETRPRG
jgi:hypothetical protein